MESLTNLKLFEVSKWIMPNNLIIVNAASKTVALPLSIGRNTQS